MGQMMAALAIAYFAAANFEAVLEWTTKAKRTRVNLLWMASSVRVAALANLGKNAEARAELDSLFEQYPNLRKILGGWQIVFRNDLIAGLKKAGLEGLQP